MEKDALKKLLFENLSLSITDDYDFECKIYKITVDFDGEEICSDFITVSNNQ